MPVRITYRHILVATLSILALWTARSFVLPVVWAVILAVALWPLYKRCAGTEAPDARRIWLPLAFTAAIGLIVVLPLTLVVFEAGRDSQALLDWVDRAEKTGVPPPAWLADIPGIGHSALRWWTANLSDPDHAGPTMGRFLMASAADWAITIGADIARRSFVLLVDLVVLFILLRHGSKLGERAMVVASRLLGRFGQKFLHRLTNAVRGTVAGTIAVAFGEGALIGAGYVAAGVPRPVLFGLLTFAFAMLPFGAWVMFTAAAVILAVHGSLLAATLLFCWGAAIMLIGDNLVQPVLIGGAARLPFFWALVGTFGGLEAFGLVGIFVGPVIMVALLVAWDEASHPHGAPAVPTSP
ncbi:AI-2E family transporter [Sphingomonas cavernae]|uniref:AI-2E family transporter n=1 Tax=Sphingomonas cavernae TaxID=2320861 RepID=A0A418WN10_9SPHN|nr:AI-2E family transporter [Sphingomonas cavernae]RJF91388.1 AI-2E family transporter [Sphingomonas cavernae]